MNPGLFRALTKEEEGDFIKWARTHTKELIEAEESGKISIFHPIIRAEWGKMVLEGYRDAYPAKEVA